MKTLFAIATHSFIDVITNSSTEMFACDNAAKLDFVKQFIYENLKPYTYDEPWVFYIEDYRKYREISEELYQKGNEHFYKTGEYKDEDLIDIWNSPFNVIEGYFFDKGCKEDIKSQRKNIIRYNKYTDHFKKFKKILNEELKSLSSEKYPLEYGRKIDEEINRIYDELESLPDNEKPEWWNDMSVLIEDLFPIEELEGKIIITSSCTVSEGFEYLHEDHKKIEKILNATKYIF